MIVILDKVITEAQARYCIDKFKQELPVSDHLGKIIINNEDNFQEDPYFVEIMSTIINSAYNLKPLIDSEWSELNYWPTLTSHSLHYDSASKDTVFTSITYLNNNFRGGETFFEDGTVISPVVGRTVFFDGRKYKHGVRTVSHGTRFSLPVWYKTKDLFNDI